MKYFKQSFTALLILLSALFFSQDSFSQILFGEGFLQSPVVEVGVSGCGSYGSNGAPPAGYHANAALPGLGFVADYGNDGWGVGAPPYCGDYFVPGSPVEGFSIQVGATTYFNANTGSMCGRIDMPGFVNNYINTPAENSVDWDGNIVGGPGAGLAVYQHTWFPDTSLWFVTNVILHNTTAAPMLNVYYMRWLDPDNDQPQPGGSYQTINTVISQPDSTSCTALVEAIGSNLGCYLGLGSRNPRARVAYGGFDHAGSGITPQNVWEGTAGQMSAGTQTSDIAISVALLYDTIMPGDSVELAFAYVLSAADLEIALSQTYRYDVFANGVKNITDTLEMTLCDTNEVEIEIAGGAAKDFNWTWEPAGLLDTTEGRRVTITVDVDTTVFAYGENECDFDTVEVTIIIDTLFDRLALTTPRDTSICFGGVVELNADTGAASYTWTPNPTLSNLTIRNPLATPTDDDEYYVELENDNGCLRTDTVTIRVDTPTVEAGPDDSTCTGSAITIGGAPTTTDGFTVTWSSNPASGTAYLSSVNDTNPTVIPPVGTYGLIRYYATISAPGCTYVDSMDLWVDTAAIPTIDNLDSLYCIQDAPVVLSATPSGGMFTGPGVALGSFDPVVATVGGPHIIVYDYFDAMTGCNVQTRDTTYVSGVTTPTITGLDTMYCIDAATVVLVGTPIGGTFSGTGMVGSTFDPAIAGVGGPYNISYSYTNPITGCIDTAIEQTTVNALPTPSFSGLSAAYCVYDTAAPLTGMPAGGTFSGTGIVGNNFDPAVAGTGGPYQIIYDYTDPATLCMNSDTQTVTVNGTPVVGIFGLDAMYCIDAPSDNLIGIPISGAFTGIGMTDSVFTAAAAGVGGPYEIVYTYTNPFTGCTNTDTQQTTVVPLPTPTFTGLDTAYCIDASSSILTGIPAGGVFGGTGITLSTFDPANAGIGGPYDIDYTYTDGNGCVNYDTQQVFVNPLPAVSFSGLDPNYCVEAAAVALTGMPTGGVFTGTGMIAGDMFDPATAGLGGPYDIVYTYTDTNGCTNYDTQQVSVIIQTATFTGLDATYCIDAPLDTLQGLPGFGSFSGAGMTDSVFNPMAAGVGGPYSIMFDYVHPVTGCAASDTQQVTVVALPTPTFTGLDTAYCIDASSSILTGIPAGGVFSGTGIAGTTFDPSTAGIGGPFDVDYTYIDGNGCVNYDTQQVVVNSLPIVSFSGLQTEYCLEASAAALTGMPLGGVFTGTGMIAGDMFDPATAGLGGPYNIIYTYTDANGCTNADTQQVSVIIQTASFTGLNPIYCIDAPVANLTGMPAGGVFSGTGIAGTTFNPATASIGGPYEIIYSYMHPITGCAAADTQTVTVVALPTPTFTGLDTAYCVNAIPAVLTGMPAGGVFSGTGAVGSTFDPSNAGIGGPYEIVYTYTDGNGCVNYDTQSTVVNALPIANAGADVTTCDGVGVTLTATGGTSYNWSPGVGMAATYFVTPSVTTAYTVTVTDNNGCTASDNVTVNIQNITATTSTVEVTCNGNNDGMAVAYPGAGIAPYSFVWSDPMFQANDTAFNLTSGLYAVTVNDSRGCSVTANANVTEPAPFTVTEIIKDVDCFGNETGEVTFIPTGGTAPFAYSITLDWVTFVSGETIDGLAAGLYHVLAVDDNGCTYTYDITINQPSEIVADIMALPTSCFGYEDGIVQASATGGTPPFRFVLENGQAENTTGLFGNLGAGIYSVEVFDANECSEVVTTNVVEPDPIIVNVSPDTLVIPLGGIGQFSVSFTGASEDSVEYSWNPIGGIECADCPNPVVNTYYDGIYTVTVADVYYPAGSQPCYGKAIGYVVVEDEQPIYLPNAFSPNGDGINDIFEIYGEDIKNVEITVFDRWGEKVFQGSQQSKGWDGRYKGVMLNPSVFIYNAKIEYLNGKKIEQTGSVTLLR